MKRRMITPLLAIVLVSCGHEPPSYDSKYSTPTPSSIAPVSTATRPMTPQPPAQASFVDNFNRPDTALGLGDGWDMRGERIDSVMQAATDGFIRDGHYTYAGDSVVYALRKFRETVRGMGTVGRFRESKDGGETTIAMGISPNDELTNVVLFTANRGGWALRAQRAGKGLQPVMKGTFSPELDIGVDYQFEFDLSGDTLTVRVPGSEVTRDAPVADLLGNRAFWQEFVDAPPAAVVFDFDTVWAVENSQPLIPVDR